MFSISYSGADLRQSLRELGLGLRRPEDLLRRWRDRNALVGPGSPAPPALLFPVLLANAIFGLAIYGMTMHMHEGLGPMLRGALLAPLAAGTGFTLAMPALYILNSSQGSRLDFSTTLLAALATVSFGAMAMLASVPINWFFSLALPFKAARLLVNLAVFSGVGVCMTDVFLRVMRAVEPEHPRDPAYLWLILTGVITGELFMLLGLFNF